MLNSVKRQFCVEEIGTALDRIFDKDFDFKGERHRTIEIVYIVSGKVEIVEEEKVYLLGEGDLILHAPMEFHRIKSDAQTSPHVLNLSIAVSGQLPPRLFENVFHLTPEQHATFWKYFHLVRQAEASAQEEFSILQQAADGLSAFLIGLFRGVSVNTVLSTESSALLYKQLVRDMQKSVYQNLSLEELAEQNFISVSYVKKLFQRYANISPKRFYDILRAKEIVLLIQRGIPAAEIAEKMNFSSPNYFSLFCKKQIGMTPSQLKKNGTA